MMFVDEERVTEAIAGRLPLSQEQVDLINRIKELHADVAHLVRLMEGILYVSPKWLAIGEASIGQGFMALVRAVADAGE